MSGALPGEFFLFINIVNVSVSYDEVEMEHGIVTPHTVGQYLPGNNLNILCDDGYELQLRGKPYLLSYIVCDQNGKWDWSQVANQKL